MEIESLYWNQLSVSREMMHRLRKAESLEYFFRCGNASRVELSRYLRTSKTVAGKIVQELLNEGWLVEDEYVFTGRCPAQKLKLNSEGTWFLGLTMRDKVASYSLIAFDFENTVLLEEPLEYVDGISGRSAIDLFKRELVRFCDKVRKLMPQRKLLACSCAMGCVKDSRKQLIQADFNIRNCNLDKEFSELLGVPTVVDDPSVSMILREYWSSAYNPSAGYLYILAFPYVHSAVIIDSKVLRGENGRAGRLGLTVFPDKQQQCRTMYDLIDRDIMKVKNVGFELAWREPRKLHEVTEYFMSEKILRPRLPELSKAIVLGANAMMAAFAPHEVIVGGVPEHSYDEFRRCFKEQCAAMPADAPIALKDVRIIHTFPQTYVEALRALIFTEIVENCRKNG